MVSDTDDDFLWVLPDGTAFLVERPDGTFDFPRGVSLDVVMLFGRMVLQSARERYVRSHPAAPPLNRPRPQVIH